MKTFRLERRQVLNTNLQEAWRFFANPVNLGRITPPWLDFQITSPLPDTIYSGLDEIFRFRYHAIARRFR